MNWTTKNTANWGERWQEWASKDAALDYVGKSLESVDDDKRIIYFRSEPNY